MMRPRFRTGPFLFWAMDIPGRSKHHEQLWSFFFFFFISFHFSFLCLQMLIEPEFPRMGICKSNYRNDSRLVYFMTAYAMLKVRSNDTRDRELKIYKTKWCIII